MAAANKRYAFLSYARKDIELVKPIVLALAEAKIPFFVDNPELFGIKSGDPKYWFIQFSKTGDYPPDIKDKIRGCSVFVVFNPNLNAMDQHADMLNAFRTHYRDHYWRDVLLRAGYDPNTAFDSTPSGAYTYTGSRPRQWQRQTRS